jgi:hypothetical protein
MDLKISERTTPFADAQRTLRRLLKLTSTTTGAKAERLPQPTRNYGRRRAVILRIKVARVLERNVQGSAHEHDHFRDQPRVLVREVRFLRRARIMCISRVRP